MTPASAAPTPPVIERLARYLCGVVHITEGCWPRFEAAAHDMLDLIREPTPAQLVAGGDTIERAIFVEAKPLTDSAGAIWRAMIDEARGR